MSPTSRRVAHRPAHRRSALVAPLAAAPAAAQDTGTVSGTVVDASGQVVPGATDHAHQRAHRAMRGRSPSDERGEFAFRAVPPGSYTVRVELTGFRTIEQRNNVAQRQRPARSRQADARGRRR